MARASGLGGLGWKAGANYDFSAIIEDTQWNN
jgi:hypothetical protein